MKRVAAWAVRDQESGQRLSHYYKKWRDAQRLIDTGRWAHTGRVLDIYRTTCRADMREQ